MGESAIASDSLSLNSSRDAHIGTWWFETVIVGTEWDPALFTKKKITAPGPGQGLSSLIVL